MSHEPQALDAIALRTSIYRRPDWLLDIAVFHERFEQAYVGLPRALPIDLLMFRLKFMEEELAEWYDSTLALSVEIQKQRPDPDKISEYMSLSLDSIVDLMYVTLGTAYQQGLFPVLEEAWKRVQAANMSKIKKLKGNGTEQESGRDPVYDVVKPADFKPPSHYDLVKNHAHTSMLYLDSQEPES
jgi:predicted HAD superfamily Cof-like phosphohydrolase